MVEVHHAGSMYDLVVGDSREPLVGGLVVGLATVVLTALLEVMDLPAVRRVLTQAGDGRALYRTALCMNALNNLVIGPLVWHAAAKLMCSPLKPRAECALDVLGLVAVHALGFYLGHAAMHRPSLYRHHRLHHRFHSNVTPVSANCVSLVEYALAYMLPFVVGIFLLRPDKLALLAAVTWISVANLLVHMPALEALSARYLPALFVGTHDHLEHHKRLTCLYSAPTFSVDRIVSATAAALGAGNKTK